MASRAGWPVAMQSVQTITRSSTQHTPHSRNSHRVTLNVERPQRTQWYPSGNSIASRRRSCTPVMQSRGRHLARTASSSDHRRRRYIMKRVRIPPGRGLTIPTRTSNRVTTPAKIAMCLKRYRSKHCAQADSNRQRMDSKSYFSAFVASSCDGIRKNCKSARCATSSFTQSSQPTADCPTVRSVSGRTTRRCEPARGFSVISGR